MKKQSSYKFILAIFMLFICTFLITGVIKRQVSNMNEADAESKIQASSVELHFTPGFHHVEALNESDYIATLTELDTYKEQYNIDIIDISIINNPVTNLPHYHITYETSY